MSDVPLTEERVRNTIAVHLARRRPHDHVSTLGAGGYDLEAGRRFLADMARYGFGAPAWPAAYGGCGAAGEEVALIERVLDEFAVPDLYPFRVGLRMVGPTLLERGSEQQRARWLPPTARGEAVWCQMFSEPEAGSDLANVAMSARPSNKGWVLNGQKVWTSRGTYADWGICLARTDPLAPKHHGLTMFALRMTAPAVDDRPLRLMNGDAHFTEVFVTDAVVDDGDRMGPVGKGWSVAVTLLAHERVGGARIAARATDDERRPPRAGRLGAEGTRLSDVQAAGGSARGGDGSRWNAHRLAGVRGVHDWPVDVHPGRHRPDTTERDRRTGSRAAAGDIGRP
jgi:alkylation response protein AidB-like acyl-CoA dehydrogenase